MNIFIKNFYEFCMIDSFSNAHFSPKSYYMTNCNMTVGFCFFPKIGKVVIYLRILKKNDYSKVCHFTNIELKTKSYTNITIIHVKYI